MKNWYSFSERKQLKSTDKTATWCNVQIIWQTNIFQLDSLNENGTCVQSALPQCNVWFGGVFYIFRVSELTRHFLRISCPCLTSCLLSHHENYHFKVEDGPKIYSFGDEESVKNRGGLENATEAGRFLLFFSVRRLGIAKFGLILNVVKNHWYN